MPMRTLKKIYQRLAKQDLVEGVDCEQFCFSPIQFVSSTLPSHILLLMLKELRRDELMDIPLEYSSEDSDSGMDSDVEFMDIQLMESSSDEPEDIPLLESS